MKPMLKGPQKTCLESLNPTTTGTDRFCPLFFEFAHGFSLLLLQNIRTNVYIVRNSSVPLRRFSWDILEESSFPSYLFFHNHNYYYHCLIYSLQYTRTVATGIRSRIFPFDRPIRDTLEESSFPSHLNYMILYCFSIPEESASFPGYLIYPTLPGINILEEGSSPPSVYSVFSNYLNFLGFSRISIFLVYTIISLLSQEINAYSLIYCLLCADVVESSFPTLQLSRPLSFIQLAAHQRMKFKRPNNLPLSEIIYTPTFYILWVRNDWMESSFHIETSYYYTRAYPLLFYFPFGRYAIVLTYCYCSFNRLFPFYSMEYPRLCCLGR